MPTEKILGPRDPEQDKIDQAEATDRELDAMRKIEAALLPLTPDERARVIRAIVILYGLEDRMWQPVAIPAPQPRAVHAVSPWRWRPRRRPHCSLCKSVEHNKRTCPLNFDIVVDTTGDRT